MSKKHYEIIKRLSNIDRTLFFIKNELTTKRVKLHPSPFESGNEAITAPGGRLITFPDGNVKVHDLVTDIDILVGRDYVDIKYPGGAKVRFRPEETQRKDCSTCKHEKDARPVGHCFGCIAACNWEPKQ